MNIIKRKILLEEVTDRTYNSPTWGKILTGETFYINIILTQDIDDIGLYIDVDFIKNVTGQPITGLSVEDEIKLRLPSKMVEKYFNYNDLIITGTTDSKIEDVRTYDLKTPFKEGFNINISDYNNYKNLPISGVSRINSISEPIIYVFDTQNDANLGTDRQTSGLQYADYSGKTKTLNINGEFISIPLTTVKYIGEAFNETNSSLSASTKEEYLFGIVSPPEVNNDVFIDRGAITVMDKHLKLSEIKNLGELSRYGNGFYKLNKQ